jgi:exopolysaccharide biosynthesis polyprenyl glycosylphosphotransferase
VAGDGFLLVAACALAVQTGPGTRQYGSAAGFAVTCVIILGTRGQYRFRLGASIVSAFSRIVIATGMAAMAIISVSASVTANSHPVGLAARLWIYATVLLTAGSALLALQTRRLRRHAVVLRPTLVIGAGRVGRTIARRLRDRPELGLDPVGFIDDEPRAGAEDELPVLGGAADLSTLIIRHEVTHVIITFSRTTDANLRRLIRAGRQLGAEMLVVPRIYEEMTNRLTVERVAGIPLMHAKRPDPQGWQFAIKHGADRVVASVMLVLLAPMLAMISALVRLSSPGPILFRQRRIGRDGTEFTMLKFRTMDGSPSDRGEADAAWAARIRGEVPPCVGEADRSTPVGRFLRRTSLDELPQLVNVLRGDMALVGPRPERTGYVREFENLVYRYGDRHRVKSGITGWAQVQQLRGETSLTDRVEWDNYYIDNWSLGLDLKILLLTVPAAFGPKTARGQRPNAATSERAQPATISR